MNFVNHGGGDFLDLRGGGKQGGQGRRGVRKTEEDWRAELVEFMCWFANSACCRERREPSQRSALEDEKNGQFGLRMRVNVRKRCMLKLMICWNDEDVFQQVWRATQMNQEKVFEHRPANKEDGRSEIW